MAFSETTTIHGFHAIYRSKSKTARRFWMFFLLLQFGMFCYFTQDAVRKYFAYEMKVTVQYVNEKGSMKFPKITICNSNSMKSKEMHFLFHQKFNETLDYSNLEHHLKLAELLTPENVPIISPSFDELFSPGICFFNTLDCSNYTAHMFTFDPHTGCFQFEAGAYQRKADYLNGLRLVVDIKQDSYFKNRFQGNTRSPGVKIFLRDEKVDYLDNMDNVEAPPNQLTRIAFHKATYKRLPSPFEDQCQEKDKINFDFKILHRAGYSQSICIGSCRIYETYKKCGVVNIEESLAAKMNNVSYPIAMTEKDLACLQEFDSLYHRGLIKCPCHKICEESKYETTIYYTSWPAQVALEDWRQRLSEKLNQTITDDYIKHNLVALEIYFDTFLTKEAIHSPAYIFGMLVADLGGYLGLWLGSSVFSIAELIAHLLREASGKATGKK